MALRRRGKREKVVVGPGSRGLKAGYETKLCGELRVVRWRWHVGIWGKGINLSRGVLETEHGLQKIEKEREIGGWTRTTRV